MPTAEEARNGASRRPHAAWRCYPPLKRGAHLAEAEAAKESAAMALAATASRGHGGLPLTVSLSPLLPLPGRTWAQFKRYGLVFKIIISELMS